MWRKNYIPVAAGRTARSSLPDEAHTISISFDVIGNKQTSERQLTLIELLQESALYGFPAVGLNEGSEELVVHLPTVYGFLVFHAFFCDEDVEDLWVGHGAVTFEPLADGVADVGRRDVEGVEGAYFWSLEGRHNLVSCARGVCRRRAVVVGLTERYQSR